MKCVGDSGKIIKIDLTSEKFKMLKDELTLNYTDGKRFWSEKSYRGT